VDYKFN